jgi:hypothetical protein
MLSKNNDPTCPEEYRSIDNFVEYIEDDERPYTVAEVTELGFWLMATPLALHKVLRERGLTCSGQAHEQKVRMSGTDSPGGNRWAECKCYGGGGGDSLIGIAGRAG